MARAMIVSAGASSNEYLSARLTELGYVRPVIVPSGTEARRRMLEGGFELVIVNAPLPDEFGHELCAAAADQTDAGVILLAKAAAIDQLMPRMNQEGVLVVGPLRGGCLCRRSIGRPPETTGCSGCGRRTTASRQSWPSCA